MTESIIVGVLMAMVIGAEIFGLWIDAAKQIGRKQIGKVNIGG